MNAQNMWKFSYGQYKRAKYSRERKMRREEMDDWTREAALERKLEAAQRTIEAQAQRIAELESESNEAWPNPFLLTGNELDRAERQMRSR